MKLIIKECIYWGSFLIIPFLVLIALYRKRMKKWLLVVLCIGSLFFVWARFIEPQMIIVRNHAITTGFTGKVVLISDTHLGIYKNQRFLKRVVKVINEQNPDYVLIAGDFTYEPKPEDLITLFAPLSDINAPVYAVLGNHDTQHPGPNIRNELTSALKSHNVILLNNETVVLKDFTLLGLGDNWTKEDDITLLNSFTEADNVVVLTHNPDTTLNYTNNNNADVTLAGHTHCGQIRIPWLYKKVIPTEGSFDKGFSQELHTKLYITCGTGEDGLPMRLFNPPVVDVLEFN